VQLVDETLQGADYEKILTRRRVKREKGVRVGKVVAEDGVDGEEALRYSTIPISISKC